MKRTAIIQALSSNDAVIDSIKKQIISQIAQYLCAMELPDEMAHGVKFQRNNQPSFCFIYRDHTGLLYAKTNYDDDELYELFDIAALLSICESLRLELSDILIDL